MREIKFRVFVKESEEEPVMVYPGEASLYDLVLNSNGGFGVVADMDSWLDKSQFEVMQYTGLLDRNGVEIYEWDIVLTEKLVVKVVEWESLTMQPFGQYFEQFDEWEVIGNIYQNPELVPK